ncbi:hypothetical protein SynBOUM118_01301 [Synechococcus sp. BOUM118]|nr:hypothetical protein SynBOUM118_01301 [Synechococcus sp. BOUM118]
MISSARISTYHAEIDSIQGFILNSKTADELLMSWSCPRHQDKDKSPLKTGLLIAAYLL